MGYRERSRVFSGAPGGSIDNLTYQSVGTYYDSKIETCKDTTGRTKMENPLYLVATKRVIESPLNGEATNPSNGQVLCRFQNYIPETLATGPSPLPRNSSDSSLVHAVVARGNPSRPYVDVGTFTGELRDVPQMLRDVWHASARVYRRFGEYHGTTREKLDKAFKQGALDAFSNPDKHFIAAQFGYLPFVSDVNKMLTAGSVVAKRAQELAALKRNGSSSSQVKLDSDYTYAAGVANFSSKGKVLLKSSFADIRRYERWGVSKWTLDPGGPLDRARDFNRVARLAHESVYGLTIDASTAWNLMPWSWLVDWYSNAGDWIESKRNIVGASNSGKVCIMTSSIGMRSWRRQKGDDQFDGVTGGHMAYIRTLKERTIHVPSLTLPEVTVPILSGRQSAILGSLMTMRARGR
jgi:hypothetical protein